MTGTAMPDTDAVRVADSQVADTPLADSQVANLKVADVEARAAGMPGADPAPRPSRRAGRAGKPSRPDSAATRNRRAAAALTPEIQNRIGSQLQSLYSDLLAESTPDRFLKLLEDLDRKS
ncbi:NepR family anti-sigma factor [Pseudochelatococcus sp. B33]